MYSNEYSFLNYSFFHTLIYHTLNFRLYTSHHETKHNRTIAGIVFYHLDLVEEGERGIEGMNKSSGRHVNSDNNGNNNSNRRIPPTTIAIMNCFISKILLDPKRVNRENGNGSGGKATIDGAGTMIPVVVEWVEGCVRDSGVDEAKEEDNGRDRLDNEWVAMVFRPAVAGRLGGKGDSDRGGNSKGEGGWIKRLLYALLKEYGKFLDASLSSTNEEKVNGDGQKNHATSFPSSQSLSTLLPPDGRKFDAACRALVGGYETSSSSGLQSQLPSATKQGAGRTNRSNGGKGSKGSSKGNVKSNMKGKGGNAKKEARVWHDVEGKVTERAMAKLDMSRTSNDDDENSDERIAAAESRALAEARSVYLPSGDVGGDDDDDDAVAPWEIVDAALNDNDDDNDSNSKGKEGGWGSSLRSVFESVLSTDRQGGILRRTLTSNDLEKPLRDLSTLLESKNVASNVTSQIINAVRMALIGRSVSSFKGLKAITRIALEDIVGNLLMRPSGGNGKSEVIDVLKAVVEKRYQQQQSSKLAGAMGGFGLFGSGGNEDGGKKSKPYVIVMGEEMKKEFCVFALIFWCFLIHYFTS